MEENCLKFYQCFYDALCSMKFQTKILALKKVTSFDSKLRSETESIVVILTIIEPALLRDLEPMS